MSKLLEARASETLMYVQEIFYACGCPDCPTGGHWHPPSNAYTTKEEAEAAAAKENQHFSSSGALYGEPCETCGGCCDECTEETDCDVCIANRPDEET